MGIRHISRSAVMVLAVASLSGCTTSFSRREVDYNPIPRMEAFAKANDYRVKRSSENTLKVAKDVNWFMMIMYLRRDKFMGEYRFEDGLLEAEVWLEMRGLWGLYPWSWTHELKPQFSGCLVTPSPRKCANELMSAGGMRVEWP